MKVGAHQKYLFYMEMAKLQQAGFNIRRAADVLAGTKLTATETQDVALPEVSMAKSPTTNLPDSLS